MTSPVIRPVPYPIGGGVEVLAYTFPAAQDMAGAGWVMTGDPDPAELRPVSTWWDAIHAFPYIAGQVLFGWVDGNPFFRNTFQTQMASTLGMALLEPGQRVHLMFRAEWRLGTGFDGGAWVGAIANGTRGGLPFPNLSGGVRTFTIETVADEDGDIEIAIGVDKMNPSLNVDHSWRSFTVSTSGFDPDPFSDIIINSAVLYENGLPISITRGGATFEPNEEWEDWDFPGKTAPVVGGDELVSQRPVIRAVAMLTGERPIEQYAPGGEWGDHATIDGGRTYSTAPMRAALGSAFYLTDVICIWKRMRGDYIAVKFDKGLCTRYSIAGRDKDEGELGIEIWARQDLVSETSEGPVVASAKTTRPYSIHILPSTLTAEQAI